MSEGHQRFFERQGWTAEYFLRQAQNLGPAVHAYVGEVLKGRHFTEQTYNACRGLLRLEKQYGKDRLDAACRRGLQGAVFNYRTIQNILAGNLDRQSTDPQTELFRLPATGAISGPNYICACPSCGTILFRSISTVLLKRGITKAELVTLVDGSFIQRQRTC